MRITRVFERGSYKVGDEIELSEASSHHLGTVLRHKINDSCIIFPGDGFDYFCIITQISKRRIYVSIKKSIKIELESPINIHLIQALCKGDKMDWIIQKATELGVRSITPLVTSRTVSETSDLKRREKRYQHWQGILQHASEQSGRAVLPILHPTTDFENFMNQPCKDLGFILSPCEQNSLKKSSSLSQDITVLIGPEGGWSNNELIKASECHYLPIALGKRILRTESAGMAIISILQFMAGDL